MARAQPEREPQGNDKDHDGHNQRGSEQRPVLGMLDIEQEGRHRDEVFQHHPARDETGLAPVQHSSSRGVAKHENIPDSFKHLPNRQLLLRRNLPPQRCQFEGVESTGTLSSLPYTRSAKQPSSKHSSNLCEGNLRGKQFLIRLPVAVNLRVLRPVPRKDAVWIGVGIVRLVPLALPVRPCLRVGAGDLR